MAAAHGRLYTYDRNGNQTRAQAGSPAASRTIAYTAEDQVREIVQGSRITRFTYGPDGSRWRREDIGDPGGTRITLYLGGVERISQSGTLTWRRHVGGVAVVNVSGATETVRWLFQDHLGSIDAVTHDNGVLAAGESMSFDAHGRRRDVNDWQDQPSSNPQQTTRGFTGHEQIDAHELVHMNGRVYDPLLGRFIQADPIVQDPYAPQNWNRYTYVYNNPLNGTDPSGYSSNGGRWARIVIGLVLSAMTVGITSGPTAATVTTMNQAIAVGWVGALAGVANGMGAAKGAFSALAFFGVGEYFVSGAAESAGFKTAQGLTRSGKIVKVLAHGVTSGVMQDLQGGKFGHGFVSGAFNEAVAPWIDRVPSSVGQIAASALVGGTATKLAGGKFANGALSAAFARAFNHSLHLDRWADNYHKIPPRDQEMLSDGLVAVAGIVATEVAVGKGLGLIARAYRWLSRGSVTSHAARVRHHTSREGLEGIRNEGSINPSRGGGVHVETQPFGPARTASEETGAFGRGAYVEFDAPGNTIPTNVGPRSTGVVPTDKPLVLDGANPTFVKPPWWEF